MSGCTRLQAFRALSSLMFQYRGLLPSDAERLSSTVSTTTNDDNNNCTPSLNLSLLALLQSGMLQHVHRRDACSSASRCPFGKVSLYSGYCRLQTPNAASFAWSDSKISCVRFMMIDSAQADLGSDRNLCGSQLMLVSAVSLLTLMLGHSNINNNHHSLYSGTF